MLKRDALAQRYVQPVRFVLVLPDTARMRRIVDTFSPLISQLLPRSPRAVLAAIRTGTLLGGDGLLWVREARLR